MFEVDEFEKLSFVAKYFQGGGAEGIGGERAETFPKNAVLQEGGPVGVRELRREFVLAAGSGEDNRDVSAGGGTEDVIRGGIAGMERDDDIDFRVPGEVGDFSSSELQAGELKFLDDGEAGLDDCRIAIDADDETVALLDFSKEMVESEGEITFSRAEIDDTQRTVAGEIAGDIIDHFGETVDLSELVKFSRKDFAVAVHDADFDEEGDRLAFWEETGFFAVVIERRERVRLETGFSFLNADGAIGGPAKLIIASAGENVEVGEVMLPEVPDFRRSFIPREVAVKFLFVGLGGELQDWAFSEE